MIGKTIAYEDMVQMVVVVHPKQDPDDAEWNQFVDWLVPISLSRNETKLLVVTAGGSLNAAQRQRFINSVLTKQKVSIAVITDSKVVRGAVTVLHWFLPYQTRAYAPNDFQKAAESLGLRAAEVERARVKVQALEKAFGSKIIDHHAKGAAH